MVDDNPIPARLSTGQAQAQHFLCLFRPDDRRYVWEQFAWNSRPALSAARIVREVLRHPYIHPDVCCLVRQNKRLALRYAAEVREQ